MKRNKIKQEKKIGGSHRSQRRGSSLVTWSINILTLIASLITIFTFIYALTHGEIDDVVVWLLNNIVFVETVIELQFGITIFILITAGGISFRFSRRGR